MMLVHLGQAAIWRSFPASSYPLAHQRLFTLQSGKRSNVFLRSKDGTPIGPLSQFMSAVSLFPGIKLMASSIGTIGHQHIEGISDFETNTFVQLVFALTVQDVSSYSVTFASSFLHTVKVIENHFEEMFAYRVGNLLNVAGENTTEQHVLDALLRTVEKWKQQDIDVDICDFTLYPQLDTFPARYVMFLELFDENSQHDNNVISQQHPILQNDDAISEVKQQLCQSNHIYRDHRNAGKLGSLRCILVRSGTFSMFLHKILVTDRVSPMQVKPHRLLKNKEHIQFFYDNQIDPFSFS
ncbi:unnamed protein product [Rotaria sp. Silwood2]|nr:unnamed protein product [Rotaria sp. Silwood2]